MVNLFDIMSLSHLKQQGTNVKPRIFPNMNPNDLDLVSSLSALVTDQDGETSLGELLNCFPAEDFAVRSKSKPENFQQNYPKFSKESSSFGERLGTENAVYEEQRLMERSKDEGRSWTEDWGQGRGQGWGQGDTTERITLFHRRENEKRKRENARHHNKPRSRSPFRMDG